MAGYIGNKAAFLSSTSGADIDGNMNVDGNITLGDNDKAIFGAGSDLQIYHDGANSVISEAGTGDINIQTNGTALSILGSSGSEFMGYFRSDGEVQLFHNNAKKFETTSTGIQVTGDVRNSGVVLTQNEGGGEVQLLSGSGSVKGLIDFLDADSDNQGHMRFLNLSSDDGGVEIGVAATNPAGNVSLKTNNQERLRINPDGDISFYDDSNNAKFFWDASAERLGIGTSSPQKELHIASSQVDIRLEDTAGTTNYGEIVYTDGRMILSSDKGNAVGSSTIEFQVDNSERMRIDSSGNVGIGTSPASGVNLHLHEAGSGQMLMAFTNDTTGSGSNDGLHVGLDSSENAFVYNKESTALYFGTSNTERMRIDSSGNLLVGTTTNSSANNGVTAGNSGLITATRTSNYSAIFNRKTSDGDIAVFRKDGSTVGSIGSRNAGSLTTSYVQFYVGSSNSVGLGGTTSLRILPILNGSTSDNLIDLGVSSTRFDDIYATNGTIQTSDENEKQQIASLTDAEITAAKAISKLFKTFKWNDAVTEKGDAARTHTGVIAQQVETTMTDAGLNAGDYAFFISTTWYVDADGNEVDADTAGAITKNRKGIRYPQLLSFVAAATEQRLASIETRLDALEA